MDWPDPDRTYEQIARQIEREDTLYQTRLNACIVVNLALLAAVATQANLPDLGRKNLVIILACSAIGLAITTGIRTAIAKGSEQLGDLRDFFGKLEQEYPGRFPYPFFHGETSALQRFVQKWTPATLVFIMIWVALPILALSLFAFPDIIK
ncbi:MAG TPA: hypothetical protein VGW40_06830 [Allosphingosinicella sp.]|nr:hypothetical protein [Allosphingosinicella sp.]